MANTPYARSITTDFTSSGGEFSLESWIIEIQASAIVTALDLDETNRDGDTVTTVFKDPLSTGDETIFDGLVAAHTGAPPSPVGDVITTETTSGDGSPIFADRSLLLGRDSLKRQDDGSESMNVDGRATGTPIVMWNGTGAGDTGGDWTAGGTGSESTSADAGSGTNGWDTGVAALNDQTVLDNGSLVDIDVLYTTLRFQLQPKAYPIDSNLRLRWVDASNNQIGGQVNISEYVANLDLDVWQQVEIPIEDWNLTANVQKLQIRYRGAAGQHFWLDDFELIPAGDGPYRFQIVAPVNERWHASMLVLQLTAPETGWDSDAFGNIAGGLTNGLIVRQRRVSEGGSLWRFVVRDNKEMFGQFHPQESFIFPDGNLLVGFMMKPGKASVVVTDDDILEIVVRDDLSSISDMRAYFHYGVEEVV